MNVAEFARNLILLTPWTAAEINNRARRLRELGFLGQSGHGRRSPNLDPDTAATLLIGLSVGVNAGRCHEAVLSHRPMPPAGKSPRFFGNQTFGEALSHVLADITDKLKVERVVINKSWPEGIIEWKAGGKLKRAIYRGEELADTGYGLAAWDNFEMSGGFLHELACRIADEEDPADDDEWTAEVS